MPILNIRIKANLRDKNGCEIAAPDNFGLKKYGPRIQVTLFPPAIEGEPQGEPVAGYGLIDTGASVTCVDRQAAEKAGLTVVDEAPMSSATHESEIVPLYAGNLRIAGFSDIKMRRAYGANLQPQGLVALLGRDALASCILIVNGPQGTVTLTR